MCAQGSIAGRATSLEGGEDSALRESLVKWQMSQISRASGSTVRVIWGQGRKLGLGMGARRVSARFKVLCSAIVLFSVKYLVD